MRFLSLNPGSTGTNTPEGGHRFDQPRSCVSGSVTAWLTESHAFCFEDRRVSDSSRVVRLAADSFQASCNLFTRKDTVSIAVPQNEEHAHPPRDLRPFQFTIFVAIRLAQSVS